MTTDVELNKVMVKFLKESDDWDRMPVALKGNVNIVRMPAKKNKEATLGIEVNPNSGKNGMFFFEIGKFKNAIECFIESAKGISRLIKLAEKINGKKALVLPSEGLVV